MGSPCVLLAYVAPEVVLPLASALAGVFGFLMILGRAPFRFAAKVVRSLKRRSKPSGEKAVSRGGHPPKSH